MYGWMGKILNVNLTDSKITEIPTQPYAEEYLGGRGIASRIYWERVSPEVKPFDPENCLIFMTGPLVATGAQAATRLTVVGKSPMAFPEGFCFANIGGFIPAELKKAGFDGIILEGRAPKPVYLWVHDGKAELRDASSLWGKGAYEVGELLRQTHGEKAHYITTGQAGEQLVRTATGVGSHETSFSAGFGAVMGSKNFKALIVLGTGKPSVAEPDKLKELNKYTIHISKRIDIKMPKAMRTAGYTHFLEAIGKGNCYQCGMVCLRHLYRYSNGRIGQRKCQSHEVYLPFRYGREDEPVDTIFDAPIMCNDYSLCTVVLRPMIDWLYDCYKAGALTEQETGLPLSKIGTREFLEKLLHAIVYREGFGSLLAEGLFRAADKLPQKARALVSHHRAAPVGVEDEYPPRAFIAHTLLYSMEPRIHNPPPHEMLFTWGAWVVNRQNPDASPVNSKVLHAIAKVFWGSEEAGDFTSYEGKALAAKIIQNRTYLKDSLGLCDFGWPIIYSFNTPDHIGDPDLEAKIFTAVTGVDSSKLDKCAERIFNLQRAILAREGRKTPQADYPPEYNFTEQLGLDDCGRQMIMPGPGEEQVDATENKLDRTKFTSMLKEYYRLRGYDKETGLPKADTLAALDLQELIPTFKRQ